jgi:hypothetical protein
MTRAADAVASETKQSGGAGCPDCFVASTVAYKATVKKTFLALMKNEARPLF